MHVHAKHTPHTVFLHLVFERQYLDCHTAQQARATCSNYSSVREERAFYCTQELQYGLQPFSLLAWPRSDREDWYPLPERVLAANVPLCPEHTAPRGYAPAVPECFCVVVKRRLRRLEALFGSRRIQNPYCFQRTPQSEASS